MIRWLVTDANFCCTAADTFTGVTRGGGAPGDTI